MIRPDNPPSDGYGLARIVFACRLAALLVGGFLAFPHENRAAITSLGYDASGNQLSQQSATPSAPVILGSPPNQVVATGSLGGFSVNVSSPLAVTYQWYFNGAAISGATGDSLLFPNVTSANDGSYTVRVANASGSVTSTVYKLGVDGNGNSLPDSWELANFGNLNQTAGGDYDGDSIPNLDEYLNGTDPKVREIYYWNVASGDFTVPTNWLRYNTPGVAPRAPGPGDTAVINSGTFTIPANTTIRASQVTVNAPFTAPTGSDYTLTVTGNWTFNGPFTLTSGRRFAVTGNGGSVTVAGSTNLSGANLLAYNGAKLSFTGINAYTQPAGVTVEWRAQDANSELSFPALATITGNGSADRYLYLEVQHGGKLNLPALTAITSPVQAGGEDSHANTGVRLHAYNGSVLSLPQLSSFRDESTRPNSFLYADGSTGVIQMPLLLSPVGVQINLNAASHPEQFTSLVGTRSLEFNNGTVAMTNLTSLSGFTYIFAHNGAKLSFGNVTSYVQPVNTSVEWRAQDANSELSFPAMTTITGNGSADRYLQMFALHGGKLSLPALGAITSPVQAGGEDSHANTGVRLHAYNGSTIALPQISSFRDESTRPNSFLYAEGSTGTLQMPLLLAPVGVQINLNAASHPEQFTSLVGTRSLEFNHGTVAMANLNSLAGFTYIFAHNGAKTSFPNVSSYTQPINTSVEWRAQDAGSELSFPALTTITGSGSADRYFQLFALHGGKLSLPALSTITSPLQAGGEDSHANTGVRLHAYNGSVLSLPQLSSFRDESTRPNSFLYADGSTGVIQMPLLLSPVGVQINLNAASHPEQFTSLVGTRSLEFNNGTVAMTNLTSLAGFTYLFAHNGAKASFPSVSAYTQPAGVGVEWRAQDANSELSFPALTTITGNGSADRYLQMFALHGGKLSLPTLTSVSSPAQAGGEDSHANTGVRLHAYNGSTVAMPQLSSFRDESTRPNSFLYADGSTGTLQMPLLLAPVGVQMNLNAASHPEQFTSLVGTRSLEFNHGTVNITNLTSLSGFTYIFAYGGAKVSFPNVSAYTQPAGLSVDWRAEATNSELSFPALTTITGNATAGCYLDLIAQHGGRISLPALTSITKPNDGDPHANSGVRLYAYNGSTLSAPALSSFQDNDAHPNSSLNASGNGTFVLTNLTQSGIRGVTLNGVILPAAFVPFPLVKAVVLMNGTVKLTMPTLTGKTYQLQQSPSLISPNWQNVGSAQSGTNAPMDFTAPAPSGQYFYRVTVTPWP